MKLIPQNDSDKEIVLNLTPAEVSYIDPATFKAMFKALLYHMPYTDVIIADYEVGDEALIVIVETLSQHWQLKSIQLKRLGGTYSSAAFIGKILSNKAPSLRVMP